MKSLIVSLLFYALSVMAAAAEATRVLTLQGTITNDTVEVSAPVRLVLTLDVDKARADLVTSPPLVGTGSLTGRLRDGWLELTGQIDNGFKVELRGTLHPRGYRGTYVARPERGIAQHGSFDLTLGEKPGGL